MEHLVNVATLIAVLKVLDPTMKVVMDNDEAGRDAAVVVGVDVIDSEALLWAKDTYHAYWRTTEQGMAARGAR